LQIADWKKKSRRRQARLSFNLQSQICNRQQEVLMARILGIALARARLGRAAALLLTAGALGVASPGLAEPADSIPSGTAIQLAAAVHVSPEQAQLEAMKVEMAWLADTVTYRMALTVAPQGEALEVHGLVADEASRQRALEVARQACYLPVRDSFRVMAPGHAGRPVSPDTLRAAAKEVLVRQFGERGGTIDVQVGPEGRLALRGPIGSVQDKLAASRCLRGLPGCTSISNCLSVTPIKCNGHTVTLVTNDGKHAVHGTLSGTEAPPSGGGLRIISIKAAGKDDARPELPRIQESPPPAAPKLTLPSGLPPRPAVVTAVRTEAPLPIIITGGTPRPAAPPAPTSPPVVPTRPAPSPVYVQAPSGYATNPPAAVPPQPIQSLPACSSLSPGDSGKPDAVVPVPPPSFWDRLSAFREARQHAHSTKNAVVLVRRNDVPAGQGPPAVPAPAAQPEPRVPVVHAAADPVPPPSAWPPAHRTGPAVVTPGPAGAPFRPKPLIVRQHTPTILTHPQATDEPPVIQLNTRATAKAEAPARPKAPAQPAGPVAQKPAPPKPAPPKIQPVSATVKAPPAPPEPNFASGTAGELCTIVKNVCGSLAREVKVVSTVDNKLTVRVTTTSDKQDQLIGVLLGVPAVAASNVKLEIHVTR
jgi:hypothetical protein